MGTTFQDKIIWKFTTDNNFVELNNIIYFSFTADIHSTDVETVRKFL